jgi:hypothetical protein
LLSLGGSLGISYPTFAKILGFSCGAGVLWLTYNIAVLSIRDTNANLTHTPKEQRKKNDKNKKTKGNKKQKQWSPDAYIPVMATTLVALHPGMAYYAVAGLETCLFGLLLLFGISQLLKSTNHSPTLRYLLPFALAAITRPEGILFLGGVTLYSAIRVIRDPSKQKGWLKQWLPPFLIAYSLPVLYVAFRVFYYGEWVPNTYYAKPGVLNSKMAASWSYIQGFLSLHISSPWQQKNLYQLASLAFGWGMGALLLLGCLRGIIDSPLKKQARSLLAFAALYIVFIIYAGGDWMTQYRMFQPILPLLYLSALFGWLAFRPKSAQLASVVLLVALGFYSQHASSFWKQLEGNQLIDHAHRSQQNVAMAKWLASRTKPGQSLVTDEIGALGFYTKLTIHDQWGLIDKPIANMLHKESFNPYRYRRYDQKRRRVQTKIATMLIARKPDFVAIDYQGSYPDKRPFVPSLINRLTMSELYRAIQKDYTYVRAFPIMRKPPYKHFLLFKRNNVKWRNK